MSIHQSNFQELTEFTAGDTGISPEVCAMVLRSAGKVACIEPVETEQQAQEAADRLAAMKSDIVKLCAELYCVGMDVSIKGAELSTSLGLSERELREIVSLARKQLRNMTIISGSFGYKLTANPDKIQESVDRLRSHSISQLVAARDMTRGMPTGQMRLL